MLRPALNFVGGAIRTVTETYEDVVETVRSVTPKPIIEATDYTAELIDKAIEASPIGRAEAGAELVGQQVGEATRSPELGFATGLVLGAVIPGPGEGVPAPAGIPDLRAGDQPDLEGGPRGRPGPAVPHGPSRPRPGQLRERERDRQPGREHRPADAQRATR